MLVSDARLATALALLTLLAAGLLLAWTTRAAKPARGKRRSRGTRASSEPGCLTELARYAAVLGGSLVPVVILLPRVDASWLLLAAVLAGIVLATGALTLTAAGWQALLRRGTDPVDDQLAVTGALFDLGTYVPSMSSRSDQAEGDCVGMVLLISLGGLFLLGVLAGGLVGEHLLPSPTTPTRRALRSLLAFAFAGLFGAGLVWLLRGLPL